MAHREPGWSGNAADIDESERLRRHARTAMAAANWDEAMALLRRAIALDPMSINFDLLGECLLALGHTKDAVLYLAAGTGLGHNQYKTRMKLAEALYGLGDAFRHDALWQLEEALRINPGYRSAKQLLDRWLAEHPELREHLHPRTGVGE